MNHIRTYTHVRKCNTDSALGNERGAGARTARHGSAGVRAVFVSDSRLCRTAGLVAVSGPSGGGQSLEGLECSSVELTRVNWACIRRDAQGAASSRRLVGSENDNCCIWRHSLSRHAMQTRVQRGIASTYPQRLKRASWGEGCCAAGNSRQRVQARAVPTRLPRLPCRNCCSGWFGSDPRTPPAGWRRGRRGRWARGRAAPLRPACRAVGGAPRGCSVLSSAAASAARASLARARRR